MSVSFDAAMQLCQLKKSMNLLQQYVGVLQKESKTKNLQNQALFSQITSLKKQLELKGEPSLSQRSNSLNILFQSNKKEQAQYSNLSNSKSQKGVKSMNFEQDCLIPKSYLNRMHQQLQLKSREVEDTVQLNLEMLNFLVKLQKDVVYFSNKVKQLQKQNDIYKEYIKSNFDQHGNFKITPLFQEYRANQRYQRLLLENYHLNQKLNKLQRSKLNQSIKKKIYFTNNNKTKLQNNRNISDDNIKEEQDKLRNYFSQNEQRKANITRY